MSRVPPPAAGPFAEAVERRVLFSAALPTVADADFDGDGSNELLVWVNVGRHRLTGLGLAGAGVRRGSLLVLDDGGAMVGGPLAIRVRGNAAPLAAAGDFNGDGRDDLVISGGRQVSGARRGLTLLPGNADGTFGTGVQIGSAPANATSLVAGDFNGDGRDDLAGTARGDRVVAADGDLVSYPIVFDAEGGSEFEGWQAGAGTIHQRDPRAIGVTAEGGGGLAGGSGFIFNPFIDHRPAPGFPSEAAVTGVSGEAGGAVVGGFPSDLLFPGQLPADERVFLLLGNGDFTFGPGDIGDGDGNGSGNGNGTGGPNFGDDDGDKLWFIAP